MHVGRSPGNELVVSDSDRIGASPHGVVRRHRQSAIKDLASTNGTFLNDRRIRSVTPFATETASGSARRACSRCAPRPRTCSRGRAASCWKTSCGHPLSALDGPVRDRLRARLRPASRRRPGSLIATFDPPLERRGSPRHRRRRGGAAPRGRRVPGGGPRVQGVRGRRRAGGHPGPRRRALPVQARRHARGAVRRRGRAGGRAVPPHPQDSTAATAPSCCSCSAAASRRPPPRHPVGGARLVPGR